MSHQNEELILGKILQQFDDTPMENTYLYHQDFLFHHLKTLFDYLADNIVEQIPSFKEIPFSEARNILKQLAGTGLGEGAKAFAFVTRGAPHEIESSNQVPFSPFEECFADTFREGTPEHNGFTAVCQERESLHFLLRLTTIRIVDQIAGKCPRLQSEREALEELAFNAATHGARSEFTIVRMLPQ